MGRRRENHGPPMIFNLTNNGSQAQSQSQSHGSYGAPTYHQSAPDHEQRKRGGRAIVIIPLLTALVGLTTAGVTMVTKVNPISYADNHFFGQKAKASTLQSGGVVNSGTSSASVPQSTPPPSPSGGVADMDAQQAVNDYFAYQNQGDLNAMWAMTSPDFKHLQTKDPNNDQMPDSYKQWWGTQVVGFDGPYTTYGSQKPVHDGTGGTWVQLAVKFREDHTSNAPNGPTWMSRYSVYWYRFVSINGQVVLDRGYTQSTSCPGDLSSLASCVSGMGLPGPVVATATASPSESSN